MQKNIEGLNEAEGFMKKFQTVVRSNFLDRIIFAIIVVNAIVLGLQTIPDISKSTDVILNVVDKICLGVFIVEMVLKLIAFRWRYFKSGWNWFDLIIILSSVLSEFPVLSSIRILRIFRIFRCLKIISNLKQLQIIVNAVVQALPGIGWTFLLLLVVYYMFSIIGVKMFSECSPDFFGDIPRTLLTLFQIMTLDGWASDIARQIIIEQPWSWVYFVSFVLLSSVVMLNVVVGIVVDAINNINLGKKKDFFVHEEIQSIRKSLVVLEKYIKELEER